jgi:hypothetical protein
MIVSRRSRANLAVVCLLQNLVDEGKDMNIIQERFDGKVCYIRLRPQPRW